MSVEDDSVISPTSEEEDEIKDVELMQEILLSIENFRKLPESSGSALPDSTSEDVNQAPVNLDNLTLLELNVMLDQVSQAIVCNNSLQNCLLMKEFKLLSIKRQLQAFKSDKGNPVLKNEKDAEVKGDIGKYIVKFKAPYFKNDRNFASYVIVPEKKLPFSAAKYGQRSLQWTKTDLKELEYAIKNFLSHHSFQNMMKKKPKNLAEKEKILSKYNYLRKASLYTLISDDFDDIIDWCHIASRLRKNHSPYECEKAWNIFLKPSINKKKWSKEELEKLKKCALERNYEDWDSIAQDLGTNRSGYQCFHEYVEVLMKLQEGEWSKTEEEFLIKLVKECTYGERKLWHKISYYFETRSLAQIYRKWNLSAVGKNHRVGLFEEKEDQIIIDSLIMKSGDINHVARRLNRLPSQIRYRLAQLKTSLQTRYGEWSLEEDQQLMDLVEKYGKKKWAQIAEHIPSRGRVQIRHRYEHLRKKLAMDPKKKLHELDRPQRPSHKNRKQVNIKYLLDKRVNLPAPTKASNLARDDDSDTDIGLDTSFGPLVLRKDDVEGLLIKHKGRKRVRRKQSFNSKAHQVSTHQVFFNDEIIETVEEESCNINSHDCKEEQGTIKTEVSEDLSTTVLCGEDSVESPATVPSRASSSSTNIGKLCKINNKAKTKEPVAPKPPADLSRTILDYYSSTSEYVGGPVKPSDVYNSELEIEITNAVLKLKPYKYFDKENADWWYTADRTDPYYKEVFNQVERKEKGEYEIKEGANWLLPPCLTTFEGFYNILVDIGYTPEDLHKPEDQLEEELNELYCASDEETMGAVARWKERLNTLFLWPAALSEIELDKTEGDLGTDESPGCSQVLNESEIIQLAEELNQIEDADLRAVMVRQLGLVDGTNQNKENTERLSMLVLQDDSTFQIKSEPPESPEACGVDENTEHCTEPMEIILNSSKSEQDESTEDDPLRTAEINE